MRLNIGGYAMTTKVRTLIAVVVAGAATTMGAVAYGDTATTSTPQYAATADDICSGVPARERQLGLLAFRDNIVSVAPLNEFHYAGKAKYIRTEGAVIKLRATPGISIPWLERVNGCHVALIGAGRLPGNQTTTDPFSLTGTTVTAAEVYAGYVLSVRGASVEAVHEILRRSYALQAATFSPATAMVEVR
jgi:hypothetical protein